MRASKLFSIHLIYFLDSRSIEEIEKLLESLSDKGQRESQLIASLNLNKDRLTRYYSIK